MAGDGCHHKSPTIMKMKLPNENLATNDKQNVDVFAAHLKKVYNNKRERFANAAKFIKQREVSGELGNDITLDKFDRAIAKLCCGGAPGITEVPPEVFKCPEGEHRKQLYQLVVDFWDGKADYAQWHKGLGVMVPKKGDLSDPNKWRGINLMDVCSKIFSCVMNDRLYVLLDRHGIKTQFGATPDVDY